MLQVRLRFPGSERCDDEEAACQHLMPDCDHAHHQSLKFTSYGVVLCSLNLTPLRSGLEPR